MRSKPTTERMAPPPSLNAPGASRPDLRHTHKDRTHTWVTTAEERQRTGPKQGSLYLNTDLPCPNRPLAHPTGSQSWLTPPSQGSPDQNQAVLVLGACRQGPLWKKNRKRHLRIMQCGHLWDFFYIYILLLLDRLDPFHQVSLSFSVWIQGLVLRYNTKVRSWLLPNLVSKQIPTSTQDNEINRFKLFSFGSRRFFSEGTTAWVRGSLDSVLEGWCLTEFSANLPQHTCL